MASNKNDPSQLCQAGSRRRSLKGSILLRRRRKKKGFLRILDSFLLHRRRWRIDRSLGGHWSGPRPSTTAVIISERRQRTELGPNGSGRRWICRHISAAIQARTSCIDSRRLRAARWGARTVVGLGSLLPLLFRIFDWVGALLAVERSLR